MTRELTRKLAYAELRRNYNTLYLKKVAFEIIFGIVKIVAILLTASLIAAKIGEPSVGGGPATLAKIFGLMYAAASFYFTIENVYKIKTDLNRKYRKDKVIMMMEFSED